MKKMSSYIHVSFSLSQTLASDIRHAFKGLFKFQEKNYLLTIERHINFCFHQVNSSHS